MSLRIFRDPFTTDADRYEHYIRRVFGDAMRNINDILAIQPYWLNQPHLEHCNIGNAIGKVIDDNEKFGVEINVAQFAPEELDVRLKGAHLIIEGNHEERDDEYGTIERHFVRKYTLPKDVNTEGLTSHFSKNGILSITAPKKAIDMGRKIPITPATTENMENKKKK